MRGRYFAQVIVATLVCAACAPQAPSAVVDYADRIDALLGNETTSPQPALTIEPYPRHRARVLDLHPVDLSVFDFLQLHRCDAGGLIGFRNSPLGKVMAPIERFDYEMQLSATLENCWHRNDDQTLRSALSAWAAAKANEAPKVRWNVGFGSEELALFFSTSRFVGEQGSSLGSRQEVGAAGNMRILLLEQLFSAQDQAPLRSALQGISHRRGEGGELLLRATEFHRQLRRVVESLRQAIEHRRVCLQAQATPLARHLVTVFRNHYAARIQPELARLSHELDAMSAVLLAALNEQGSATPAVRIWVEQQFGAAGLGARLRAVSIEHARIWMTLLGSCGMSLHQVSSARAGRGCNAVGLAKEVIG